MVAARYIEEKYLNPLREKRIKREEEAMKRIREEGHKQGSAEASARWEAWNERRLAAEAKGEPFDEPTPATLRNRRSDNGPAPPHWPNIPSPLTQGAMSSLPPHAMKGPALGIAIIPRRSIQRRNDTHILVVQQL